MKKDGQSLSVASLTVAAVLVDLRVGLDLHGGATRHLGHLALHVGAHYQVVVLVDAFEFLPYAQLLIPRQKGHVGLPCELAPWPKQRRGGQLSGLK